MRKHNCQQERTENPIDRNAVLIPEGKLLAISDNQKLSVPVL